MRKGTVSGVCSFWLLCSLVFAAETPPPDGDWRPHRLARCQAHFVARGEVRDLFAEARDLFEAANGGDAAELLEYGLRTAGANPWLLLLLAQIYVLAGQGEPHCQPLTGPVAPTGDWDTDRLRLLERSDVLLQRLAQAWPDDSVVDFLRADVARSRGDLDAAAVYDDLGRRKCTYLESVGLLRDLRGLRERPAKVLAPLVPVYPESALRKRIEGEVLLDLLVDPFGRVAEAVPIGRAHPVLVEAACAALPEAGFAAAQVGYYPIWSWLRVPVRFRLHN
ncbi:MAG: TonB family protein [Candidatus Krumholzibacteria bacterium]|nr:TonB family protein [Candidatus Krumholzibacteria bacterium]